MNLFFEESGDFKAGSVLSQAGEAFQVELISGKRSKVKAKDVLLQFATPDAASLMEEAKIIATEIDLSFLWEVAGQDEFSFDDLGAEYFGAKPQAAQSAGLLFALHSAPIYFYKKGRGRYKAAPEASLNAALAGIEKKKQQAIIQASYVDDLKNNRLPDALAKIGLPLLFKPDKNGIEYKALAQACDELQTTPARLMLAVGGLKSAKDFHLSKFLLENFPKGIGFPPLPLPASPADLPVANVQAFSIDDVSTTEIDDALSVVVLDANTVRIGIHIAAPALSIMRGDAIDTLARTRMSTVYLPGDKITMLPENVVDVYTLGEGQARPAVSLYVTVNTEDWSITASETKVEAVPISANLRHNDLDALITEESLANDEGDYPHKADIAILWKFAQVLEAARMLKREGFGLRPEQNNRIDFNFDVDDDVVTITRRKRGAPLDKIVSELMILANSTWGKFIADHGIPGIYRAQGGGPGGWAAKMQVRMITHPAPHQGLGVDQYAWSTSPLRRYTDLVNQWQIIACVKNGVTAPLVAPFKPKDADLYSIVSGFDAAYAAYSEFQNNMERYWCLRWLAQENKKIVEAVVLKDEVLRLVEIPLIIRLASVPAAARGAQAKLDIVRWDELELTVEARLLEVLNNVDEENLDAENFDAESFEAENFEAENLDADSLEEANLAEGMEVDGMQDNGMEDDSAENLGAEEAIVDADTKVDNAASASPLDI